jgi:Protein of unknown function DUF2620
VIKIVVTGMGKERIAQLARDVGAGEVEVSVKTDFEAALAVQNGAASYYIGSCQSGAGGALGVATAILGSRDVFRISGAGTTADLEHIEGAINDGVHAFGLAHIHIEAVVPALVKAMVKSGAA